ncbi:hypothetical protein ABK040_002643 [Willaertia magna]
MSYLVNQLFNFNKKENKTTSTNSSSNLPTTPPQFMEQENKNEENLLSEEHLHFSSLSIHGDNNIEDISDIAPPIHLSTTFDIDISNRQIYSRVHNATRDRLETILGQLEGINENSLENSLQNSLQNKTNERFYATTFSSGQGATSSLLFYLKPKLIYINEKYGGYHGTKDAIEMLNKFGGHYKKESVIKVKDLSELIKDVNLESNNDVNNFNPYKGTIVWLETPLNPTCELEDISYYCKLAKQIGAYVVVDSTFASPVLQKPLLIDPQVKFVVHSCTKFMGGHSDLLGGVVISRTYQPSSDLRIQRSIFGNIMGNLECWLLLRSLKTLELRVKHQSSTANQLAKWFSSQINNKTTNCHVTKVFYPLDSNQLEICKKQMNGNGPGILSIELDTKENARKLPSLLKLVRNATSLGGVESLIDYRYQWDSDISPTLLRISIGLENLNDLINDFNQALLKL